MTQFSSLYSARLDRELGSEDSTILFTTARRKAAVNEGQAEWADLTECLQRQTSITLTAGTARYNLNSTLVIPAGDFGRFSKEQVQFRYTDASSAVQVLAGDDLPRRDVEWLNRHDPGWQVSTVASSVAQLPSVYYLQDDGGGLYLGFYPTPSTGSSASMDALVPYLAQPTAMTDSTHEPFTLGGSVRTDLRPFHQALVHYAAYQLEKLRRDDEASERQLQKFTGYVARYLAEKRAKGGRMVTYVRSYFNTRGTDRGEDPRT